MLVNLILRKDFLTSLQMADFLVVIGGNLVSSWRPHNHDLTYVLLKGSPQNHHTGDRAQHGIRREGTQRFIQLFMVALCIYFFEQNIRFKHLNLGSNVGLNLTITQASV